MKNPRFNVGEIVRYGSGETALMRITDMPKYADPLSGGRYYGRQFYGDSVGAYEVDMRLANSEERAAFIEEESKRRVSPLNDIMERVQAEVKAAKELWPAMNSAHEGYGVIKEEFDELWDEIKVKQKNRDLVKMQKEAIQVAAMAIRFATEVCDEINGRK